MDDADWKDRFTEIAGYLEYDCGLPRKQAEYEARRLVQTEQTAYRKETEHLAAGKPAREGA